MTLKMKNFDNNNSNLCMKIDEEKKSTSVNPPLPSKYLN